MTSVLRDVNSALSQPTFTARCAEVRSVFTRLAEKDLHQVFPQLLANVFGFDGSMGWGLKILHRTQHAQDFESVLQFLSPRGTMFLLIEKLQRDPDVCFEFPISCLPMATQQQLASGTVPVMYQQKLRRPQGQLGQIVETDQTVIWLNAFEYYMFHFAYWLAVWAGKSEPPWTDLAESLYLNILDLYCKALLPVQGNINIGPDSTSTRISPPQIRTAQSSQPIRSRHYWSPEAALLSWNGLTPPYDYRPVPGLLKLSAVTPLSGLSGSRGSYMNETWCSETFAQILAEFWLNQVPSEQSAGISFVNVRQAAMPCQEHVRLVRVLIKHVHYFTAAANRHTSQSLATLQLRRTIVPDIFQKKIFNFLHHAFIHWPLDSTFRVVLETWLSYIQPWRYDDPSRAVDGHQSPVPQLSHIDWNNWKPFLHENILFYTVLMTDFLQRALKLNMIDFRDSVLIQRVAKVFSNQEMMTLIEDCDTVVKTNASFSAVPGVPAVAGAMTQTQYNFKLVQYLMGSISIALHSLKNSTDQPTATSSPTPTHTHPLETPGSGLVSRLEAFLSTFVDDPKPQKETVSLGDRARIIQQLEQAFEFFKQGFEVTTVLIPHTGVLSGQLVSSIPLSLLDEQISSVLESSKVALPYLTDCSTPSRIGSLEPDYLPGSDKQILSPLGRRQVSRGIRKCDPSTVKPRTDPLLMPICPHENATLVRLLHHASQRLYNKVGPTLLEWRSDGGLLSWLATAILTEPVSGWKEIERHYVATPPRQPGSDDPGLPVNMDKIRHIRPGYEPRISLRFLASYPNMFWLCVLMVICKVIGLSWGVLFSLILALFVVFVVLRNIQ